MDMQNVIAEQYIVRRRKPLRIIPNRNLVHPVENTHIERQQVRARVRNEYAYTPGLSQVAADKATKHKERISVHTRLCLFLESLSTPAKFIPVSSILGLVVVSLAMAFASGMERPAKLETFMLPHDGLSAAILLDSISTEPVALDESMGMPDLPMTLSVANYKVVKNDTLDSIARRYGLRLDTLISVNRLSDARRITAGTTLKIPNIDGVAYTIRKGENLSSIASAQGVSVLDLIDANDLSSQTIVPGQSLFIPGARLASYDLKKALGTLVIWPINGPISSSFGYRASPFTGVRQFHNGLDIVGRENTPIKAAMDGKVAETGYSAVFGNFVILTHPEGYQTLYAHLNKINVKQGTSITQGSSIGLLGSTGYSTGPHVHFGVFKRGVAIDPLKLLKGM
jgi:murein DD-endopeptidase MepM/ murein hydrolase activator NlpD